MTPLLATPLDVNASTNTQRSAFKTTQHSGEDFSTTYSGGHPMIAQDEIASDLPQNTDVQPELRLIDAENESGESLKSDILTVEAEVEETDASSNRQDIPDDVETLSKPAHRDATHEELINNPRHSKPSVPPEEASAPATQFGSDEESVPASGRPVERQDFNVGNNTFKRNLMHAEHATSLGKPRNATTAEVGVVPDSGTRRNKEPSALPSPSAGSFPTTDQAKMPLHANSSSLIAGQMSKAPEKIEEKWSARFERSSSEQRWHQDIPPPAVKAVTSAGTKSMPSQIGFSHPSMAVSVTEAKLSALSDTNLVATSEPEFVTSELRTTSSPSTQQPVITHSHLPRHTQLQIAEAAKAAVNKPVEISLNPEELGRVRLSVSASDGNVVIQVLAERFETLDLLRRNSEELGRQLQQHGFESMNLSFGHGEANNQNKNSGETEALSSKETELEVEHRPVSPHITSGLDLRV